MAESDGRFALSCADTDWLRQAGQAPYDTRTPKGGPAQASLSWSGATVKCKSS